METDNIITILDENVDIREEIIDWLNDNGYLDDFKIYAGGNDEY